MKKIGLFLLALCCFSQVWSQGSIKGKLVDSLSGSPLGLATVTVFQAADTTLITYRLSNHDGDFRVTGIPLNKACRVIISYSGYDAFRKEFTLTDENPLDLGKVELLPGSKTLEEVLVIAERPPVTVRKDTIEFNASSFKTLPTSLVEDLLRKLPGVEVDRDGNITANGRRVNRILVDGKSFFGDDPKMATRNLPANVIEKVQLTEDKDESARNSDGDLTNVGQVINLTLKKGIKKGWFGKAYAGAGTENRYEVGGIANIYRDTLQLSVLGFSNNMNRSGFSFKEVQDMGGFNRSGFNSVWMTTRGGQTGFALNGISFGGMEQGIARTSGGGFNLNHAPNKKQSLFLQYFYGNTRSRVLQTTNNQQYIQDTTIISRTGTRNDKQTNAHNFGAGAILKPDSLTDINFRSGFSLAGINENVLAQINVRNNKAGLLSEGTGNQYNNTNSLNYNHNLFVTRRWGSKKGRTLNIINNINYNRNRNNYITESEYHYYEPVVQDLLFEQLRRQVTPVFNGQLSLYYSEPLNSKFTLRFNNRAEYITDQQDIGIYDKDASQKYEKVNDAKSSGFERSQKRFNSNLALSYKIKKVNLTAGINGLWQQITNQFKQTNQPVEMTLFNVLPNFSMQYKQLSVHYSQSVNAPSIFHLIPVPDSTNPFYIRYGNANLSPSKRRSLNLNNFTFLQASGTSINVYVNASFIDNDVVMSRRVGSNGITTVQPVNADGTVDFYAGLGFGKEFKNKQKFIFSFRFNPWINFNKTKMIINDQTSYASNFRFGPNFNIGLNWNDIIEFRPQYSPSFTRTSYTDPSFKNIKVITHYLESELIVRWPKKLVWETNVAYRTNADVAPGLPKENLLWNAAVTLLMMKGDVGMLKLGVFDLLNRNNGYTRFANLNQVIDQETNVLQRYFSLSFTYNIRNMGAKKVGGKDRLFMF
jgi:hypothetical protein